MEIMAAHDEVGDLEGAMAEVCLESEGDDLILDSLEVEAVRQCAAATPEGEAVLVLILVGSVGAGKSATANRLGGKADYRESRY